MTTEQIPPGTGTAGRTAGGAPGTGRDRARRPGAWSLPEVRWAAVATALFAVGLIAHVAAAPAAVVASSTAGGVLRPAGSFTSWPMRSG